MVETFLPFSDAVMAALASRSHEWSFWEIRECTQGVVLVLELPGGRHAEILCNPSSDSPSECVTRLIQAAAAGKSPTLSPFKAERIRNSRGAGAQK